MLFLTQGEAAMTSRTIRNAPAKSPARSHDSAASRIPQSLTSHRPPRPEEGRAARPTLNIAESPLSWLRSRKDRDGRPMISDMQFLAGERLRAEFERALMGRRVTMNWDAAGAGGRGHSGTDISDAAIAAKDRYRKALDAVGPELGAILVQVCCLEYGIEQAERVLALPQRSGKAVLGLGLTALARHYGYLKDGPVRRDNIFSWGLDGYRPDLAALQPAEA
jgi:hypothetical protein